MKKTLRLILFVALLCLARPATAQSTSISNATPVAPAAAEKEAASYEKHAKAVMDALKLDDAASAAKVHDVMVAQLAIWKSWHAQNDAQLKQLWAEYNKTRSTRIETNINSAMGRIEAVYATLKPQHDAFIAKLSALISSQQIETVEDVLTAKKVEATFNAYGQIFQGLTEEQKAFILKNLKAAREEAIDAGSMSEKSAFFKKYKDRIEAYLTAQGYDVKQAYKDFVAKQKAEMAAKKAAKTDAKEPAENE